MFEKRKCKKLYNTADIEPLLSEILEIENT
jgi:hypothetical protein